MHPSIVVIGTSLGGLAALETLLPALPPDFPAPIVVVRHRHPRSPETLVPTLSRRSPLPVREPDDKEAILPGRVYVAPADYHLLIDGDSFALSTEGPVRYARPSVDALFESAAGSHDGGVLAVVLTGSNDDGARGAARVKQGGGTLIVQDPDSAECSRMPAAALAAAAPDYRLPLEQIGPIIVRLCSAAEGGR